MRCIPTAGRDERHGLLLPSLPEDRRSHLARLQGSLSQARQGTLGLYDDIVARHDPKMFFTGNLGGGFAGGDIDP